MRISTEDLNLMAIGKQGSLESLTDQTGSTRQQDPHAESDSASEE